MATLTRPRNPVYKPFVKSTLRRLLIVSGATAMNSSGAQQIVLGARPNGKPKLTDFRLEESSVPTPGSGQTLLRVLYLSLDPYMRGAMDDRKSYAEPLQISDVISARQWRRSSFPIGPIIQWETLSWRKPDGALTRFPTVRAFASLIPPRLQ